MWIRDLLTSVSGKSSIVKHRIPVEKMPVVGAGTDMPFFSQYFVVVSTNQTSWSCGEYGSSSNIPTNFEISVFKPFDTVHTTMRSQNTSLSNGVDLLRIDYFDSVHKADTSFSGYTILAASGNITGSVSVFGYAKA